VFLLRRTSSSIDSFQFRGIWIFEIFLPLRGRGKELLLTGFLFIDGFRRVPEGGGRCCWCRFFPFLHDLNTPGGIPTCLGCVSSFCRDSFILGFPFFCARKIVFQLRRRGFVLHLTPLYALALSISHGILPCHLCSELPSGRFYLPLLKPGDSFPLAELPTANVCCWRQEDLYPQTKTTRFLCPFFPLLDDFCHFPLLSLKPYKLGFRPSGPPMQRFSKIFYKEVREFREFSLNSSCTQGFFSLCKFFFDFR